MSHKGKIYGLVGVIGSGKTYRATNLMIDAANEERPMIIGDFSEGIRQTLMNILTGKGREIQCDGEVYATWKTLNQVVALPTSGNGVFPDTVFVSGRQLLENTGEHLKELFGNDIWANYTAKNIIKLWGSFDLKKAEECDIVFGSLRFLCEARAAFKVAERTGKEIQIIFHDYRSDKYEIRDHASEKFAQYWLGQGCKDRDDITELVRELLNE